MRKPTYKLIKKLEDQNLCKLFKWLHNTKARVENQGFLSDLDIYILGIMDLILSSHEWPHHLDKREDLIL